MHRVREDIAVIVLETGCTLEFRAHNHDRFEAHGNEINITQKVVYCASLVRQAVGFKVPTPISSNQHRPMRYLLVQLRVN